MAVELSVWARVVGDEGELGVGGAGGGERHSTQCMGHQEGLYTHTHTPIHKPTDVNEYKPTPIHTDM